MFPTGLVGGPLGSNNFPNRLFDIYEGQRVKEDDALMDDVVFLNRLPLVLGCVSVRLRRPFFEN